METLKKGTLLYRGIDCVPGNVVDPARVNTMEGILWLAPNSAVAQSYIPRVGGRTSIGLPSDFQLDETPSPDDGLMTAIMAKMGTQIEVTKREWDLSRYPGYPKEMPDCPVVNGTYGRPWAWSRKGPKVTWRDILTHLQSLGYDTKPKNRNYILLNTARAFEILPSNHRLQGSLVIYEVTDDIKGVAMGNDSEGLMDPDYHHACKWSAAACAKGHDFIKIHDYCQTEQWGNVGHWSYALNANAIPKIKTLSIIQAIHRGWEDEPGPYGQDTPEERAWRLSVKQAEETLRPVKIDELKQSVGAGMAAPMAV